MTQFEIAAYGHLAALVFDRERLDEKARELVFAHVRELDKFGLKNRYRMELDQKKLAKLLKIYHDYLPEKFKFQATCYQAIHLGEAAE